MIIYSKKIEFYSKKYKEIKHKMIKDCISSLKKENEGLKRKLEESEDKFNKKTKIVSTEESKGFEKSLQNLSKKKKI